MFGGFGFIGFGVLAVIGLALWLLGAQFLDHGAGVAVFGKIMLGLFGFCFLALAVLVFAPSITA